jgi:hypothetical protein
VPEDTKKFSFAERSPKAWDDLIDYLVELALDDAAKEAAEQYIAPETGERPEAG